MKNKVIITGVAGFIGSNLAERLLKSNAYKVVGIDNLTYGVKEQIPKGVEFHEMDIRSNRIYPLFKGVDFVFHLAAKNCISDCQDNPIETSDINITGTVNIFEAAKRCGVKKVIYAESSAIYEDSTLFPTPETENHPRSFYAISKACSSLFASRYHFFFGLKTTGLRYFNVYGPRQDYRRTIPPVMSAFIIRLLSGKPPIIYGNGKKRRDFIYIDDVNDFHLLCLQNNSTDNEIFNIGSSKNYSILDIYNIISSILKIKTPLVYKQDLPGEAQETLADITKAQKISWVPKTNIEVGLKNMIDYIKKEIALGNIK